MKKVLTIGLVLCIAMSIAVGSAGALSNSGGGTWLYQREITIQENSGKTLTNYQVLVELTGSDFPTETQSNGDDIRFTDADGKKLSYWIEEYDYSGKHAKIWVNVPNVPANGGAKIKMYYGNPSASSQSDGDATFDIFEDFDVDDGEWTEYDPNNKIVLDYTTDHRLEFNNWIRTDPGYVTKSHSIQNFVEEYDFDITAYGGNANTIGPGFSDTLGTRDQIENGVYSAYYAGSDCGGTQIVLVTRENGNPVWAINHPSCANRIRLSPNTIYYARLKNFEDTVKLSIFSDVVRTMHISGSPIEVPTNLASTTFNYYYLVSGCTHTPPQNWEWTTGWMDNFKVRKYIHTEPTITVGAEQPMPTPTNLLENPGFEDGFNNWERSTEEGDVDFYIGASAHSGSKSGGIHIMSSGGWGHYSQEVPISNCKNIHAEVWANLAFGSEDKAELAVQTYDADDNLLDHEHKSVDCTEWTKISLDFSPDPNAVSAVVFLDGASTGEDYVIFDDAYLGVSDSSVNDPIAHIDIQHTYCGDLHVYIGVGGPSHTYIEKCVWDAEGGAADDLKIDVALEGFAKYWPPIGIPGWYLKVYDDVGSDEGMIQSFSVEYQGESYASPDHPEIIDYEACYASIPASYFLAITGAPYKVRLQREAVGSRHAYSEFIWPLYVPEEDVGLGYSYTASDLTITALDGCKIYVRPLFVEDFVEDGEALTNIVELGLSIGGAIVGLVAAKEGFVLSVMGITLGLDELFKGEDPYHPIRPVDEVTLEVIDNEPRGYFIQISDVHNPGIFKAKVKMTSRFRCYRYGSFEPFTVTREQIFYFRYYKP